MAIPSAEVLYLSGARRPLPFGMGMNGPLYAPVSPLCARMAGRPACTLPTQSMWAFQAESFAWVKVRTHRGLGCRALPAVVHSELATQHRDARNVP
jgi:hypothetical protein